MKTYAIVGVIVAVLIGLFAWGRFNAAQKPVTYWNDTAIACLPNGHQNLSLHIHQELFVLVDGVEEPVPANIGVAPSCMAEVHTHDATGKIHVEAVDSSKQFTLKDLFVVQNIAIERPGYALAIEVNGKSVPIAADLELADGQRIVMSYTSIPRE